MKNTIKNKDFVELKFTGYVNGNVFDSNIEEDLKQISQEAKPEKLIIAVGEKMVVNGLDNALEDKEIGKEYRIEIPYKDGFGERKRELVKTIPLKVFTQQKVNPVPGASFILDNMMARVITVSGARVITDFNSPLAGKDLKYKFTIVREVTDAKEKSEAFLKFFFRFVPHFEISEDKVFIMGPQAMEYLVNPNKEKFKALIGKELVFSLVTENKRHSESPESPEPSEPLESPESPEFSKSQEFPESKGKKEHHAHNHPHN